MATSGSWSEYVYGNSTVGAGSWKVTASRGGTSSTATVTVSLTITESWGKGNEYDYYLYVDGVQRASNTSIHYEGSSCTLSYTYYPSAADAGGSISGNLQFRAYLVSSSSYSSKTGSYTVSYGSKTTYTISYNANGGSGAPSSQTKYHGTPLTLSSTKPTRSGYDFLGWSTSSTATSATWGAGGSYTTNASNTLYAVWKASTSTIISATEQIALSMDNSVNASVTWKPNDSSFKFRITASIPASVGTAYTVTFPSSSTYFTPNVTSNTTESITFDSVWISKITKDNSATCTLTLYTYNSGGTQLGSGSAKDIRLTLPTDRLSPTVSISSISKTTNFFTKYCIGLDAVQIAWTFTPNTGSSLKNGIITVDGQMGYPTSTSTYSSTILSNIGSRNITVSAEDQRSNISNQVSRTIQVYKYFYPDVNIKYLPNKKLDITGNIAYVAGENQPKILLSIYEGNSSTPVSGADNLNITNSGTWAGVGETYEKYYPINFGDGYDVSTLIPNIDTTSYKFQVKVYDSVTDGTSNYVIASTISVAPIMTFGAGGMNITAHKPMKFEQGIESDLEVLNRDSTNLGGRLVLKGSGSYADAYIEHYQQDIIFHTGDGVRTAGINYTNGECGFKDYFYYRDSTYTHCYPPIITSGTTTSGNTRNSTLYWRMLYYTDYYKEMWATMAITPQFSSTYGSFYYENITMMLPTSFTNTGNGTAHFNVSFNTHSGSGGGIFGLNVNSLNTSTGAIKIYVGNAVQSTSITGQLVVHGTKF